MPKHDREKDAGKSVTELLDEAEQHLEAAQTATSGIYQASARLEALSRGNGAAAYRERESKVAAQ